MSTIYLPWTASRRRLREAEEARKNRAEVVRELSHGRLTRRDLMKAGLFTAGGMLAPIGGFNPFVASARADGSSIPTGAPPSPLFGAKPFTQPMGRFDVLQRHPLSYLSPGPMADANQTLQPVPAVLGGEWVLSRGVRRARSGRTSGSTSSLRRCAWTRCRPER